MGKSKKFSIDLSGMSGGINTVEDPLKIRSNQVATGTINARLLRTGAERRAGIQSISDTNRFTTFIKGLHNYLQDDGTERLLTLSATKLYEVTTTTGALTERYTLGGVGNGSFEDYHDKCWVCNGTNVVKLEDEVAYQVGITPPSGATATAAAGGSLADGVYKLFISYYRKVSGVIVLYSVGESVADVTLGTGNNTIDITVPDSADLQVGGVNVWMTDAGGNTYYQYHTADGTGAYSFSITDTTNKDETELYTVQAIQNGVPPAFTALTFHNRRLWGMLGDKLYYSLEDGNVYDLEKFASTAIIQYHYQLQSVFSLGDHIYVGTPNGTIRQPYGDPGSIKENVSGKLYFKYQNTIVKWNNQALGLTNDGVRLFDGVNWTDFDISRDAKTEIDKIYKYSDADHPPGGIVLKTRDRTEYHLTYIDDTVGTVCNNRRLILDLDNMGVGVDGSFYTPWEMHNSGAEYLAKNSGDTMFSAQSTDTDQYSLIYEERLRDSKKVASTYDKRVYSEGGPFLSTDTVQYLKIVTKTIIPNIMQKNRLNMLRAWLQLGSTATFKIIIDDSLGNSDSGNLESSDSGTLPLFGTAIFGTSFFVAVSSKMYREKLSALLVGYAFHVEITQLNDDSAFKIMGITIEGNGIIGRFT